MTTGLRIGEAAGALGVSPSALRLWERQGLVAPRRTGGGYRVYSAHDLDRLADVHRMRRIDRVNASGIRRLLDADPSAPLHGTALRRQRTRRGLTLRDAAAAAGISAGHLAAIERGDRRPSVAALRRITRAYGTTLAALAGEEEPRRVVRTGERATLHLGQGVRIQQLAVGARALESQLFILERAASSDGAYSHAGEEFLYVLEGAVTVWIEPRERHDLVTGDALSFPSTLPHRWHNAASGETRLLWINTPPTF